VKIHIEANYNPKQKEVFSPVTLGPNFRPLGNPCAPGAGWPRGLGVILSELVTGKLMTKDRCVQKPLCLNTKVRPRTDGVWV